MTLPLFEGAPSRTQMLLLGLTVGPLVALAIAGMLFLRLEAIDRAAVFGCYATPGAPALQIKRDAIHITGIDRRTFSYSTEPSKRGYQLSVRPALQLAPITGGRYAFVATDGLGYFWPLLPVAGKNQNRVRHPHEYAGRFALVASNGIEVVYTKGRQAQGLRLNVHKSA